MSASLGEAHTWLGSSRCVAPYNIGINEQFDFIFDIKGKQSIDITNDVRDQLIFLHPQKYLCSEHCKGLCPQCGVNLNTGTCTCAQKNENKAFAKLKDMLKEKEKEC